MPSDEASIVFWSLFIELFELKCDNNIVYVAIKIKFKPTDGGIHQTFQ